VADDQLRLTRRRLPVRALGDLAVGAAHSNQETRTSKPPVSRAGSATSSTAAVPGSPGTTVIERMHAILSRDRPS
jgi:hypothetical protein